jgi:hypothetical protein
LPLYRMQMSFGGDTALLKDRIVNTFHLNDGGVGSDPENLATDAVAVFQQWYGTTRYASCTVYEVAGPPPHYPVAFHEVNNGQTPSSTGPREVALCLSYYAERNLPRQRGRIFLCVPFNNGITINERPSTPVQQLVMDLGQSIADLGGVDVDWQVYSPTTQTSKNVTNIWCDNEWDTIRSRGLQPSNRLEATVDE